LRAAIPPTAYLAMAQDASHGTTLVYAVRSTADPNALIAGLSKAIGDVQKDISYDFSTLATQIDDSLIQERMLAELAGFFGALALLVAGVGLYGVIWLAMTRRRNEIGIRLALGAEPAGVIRMVLRELAVVTLIGLTIGTTASFATARLVQSLLFALTPTDPLT